MFLLVKNFIALAGLFGIGYGIAWWGAGRELRRLMGPRYVACFLVIIFAGFFAPSIWIFHVVAIATFLGTTRDREEAITRYVVMLGLFPSLTTVIVVGGTYLGTYQSAAVLGIAMLIAGAVKPERNRAARPPRGWRVEDTAAAALFVTFSIGSTHYGSATVILRSLLTTGADMLLPYWLLRRYVRSPAELRRVIGCLAFSALSIAMIAIYEARMSWPLYDAIQYRLSMVYGMAAATNRRGGALRATAGLGNSLALAYFLMLAIVAWLCSRHFFAKSIVWKGGIALLAVAALAPQSRGLLVALLPALIVLLVTRRRYAAAAGLLGAGGAGAAALFVLQHSSERIAAFVGGNQTGIYYDYRGLLLHRGLQEGFRHWLFGQSYHDVVSSLIDITQGEHIVDLVNTYLAVFLQAGVIGLLPFVLGTFVAVRKLIARAPRGAAMEAARDNRAFLLSALIGTLVYIYSVSFVERMAVYTLALLALTRLGSAQLVRGDRRPVPARPASEPAPIAAPLVPA